MKRLFSIFAAGVLLCLVAGSPVADTLYVPGGYATIQAAVDAAFPGDVIVIAAGTYVEQVEITKAITLDGGGAAVIQSPATLTKYFTTSTTNKPIVYIHDCDGAIIKDLTVDGLGLGNANYRFVGVAFWNASGTVEGCVIKDIRDTPFSGAQHGNAIYSYSTGTEAYSVNVWDCEIYGFQKNAMALNAGDTNPFTVDVRRNVITGAGATTVTAQNGIQVWADLGTGTVADNVISGIAYDNTLNPTKYVATSILDYWADLAITGNTITDGHMGIYAVEGACDISGNDLTIEKVGVSGFGVCATDPPNAKPSPFGEEAPLGASQRAVAGTLTTLGITIEDNTVAFSGADNVNTIGLEADAGYSAYDLDVAVNGNVVTGFDYGVEFWQCTGTCDVGTFLAIAAHDNDIVGNTSAGMESNASYLTVDATGNWWGDATGPYHATLNPTGLGDAVSDYIDFDPWTASTHEVSVVPASTLTNCSGSRTVAFDIDQLAGLPDEVRGYEVKFTIDPAVVSVAGITEGTYLDDVGDGQFYTSGSGASWTVTCAILGGDAGGAGAGTLFTVELASVAEGTSAIDITSVKLRDLDNDPIAVSVVDGSITLECVAPTIDPITPEEGGWYNAAPVIALGFHDNANLDRAEYNYNGGSWVTIFSGLDAADWTNAAWTLPDFGSLPQGTNTIYFRVYDDAGNSATASWQFYKDTVPPQPPTNFVSLPGHNKTHLSWTNPTGDDTFVGVEIRFNGWLDYPEYEATTPVYPPNAGAGTYVALVTGTSYVDDPRTPRDIYYYAAFSKDLAGNYSTLGTTAYDRCTSYWLGDAVVSGAPPLGDGYVNLSDLSAFSQTFGVSEGGATWDAHCDFGPTDDNRRFGIPLPDDLVDFEDLMILAMNYNKVLPSGLDQLAAAARGAEDLGRLVGLEIVANDDGTFSIVLANRASTLKGLRIVVEATGGVIEGVARGSILGGSGDCFFGLVPASPNRADISVAALGVETPLAVSGEAARLAVRADGSGTARVRIVSVDLRDLDNARTEIAADGEGEAPFVPKATALLQNFPNPFNPTTTMTFDLVAPGHVRIDVYDVSGRLVATPVNAIVAAGRHAVEWNGRDASGSLVPSGMYFYRMKTAGYEATRKMILLR